MNVTGDFLHSATEAEIARLYDMPTQEALEQSKALSTEQDAMIAYIPNRQPTGLPVVGHDGTFDVQGIASELRLRVVPEPETGQEYTLGVYCMEGATVVRGIALWLRRRKI